jgi:uncharacterized protein (TIGR02118 family)
MASFIALWPAPDEDVEGFEEHYRTVHAETVDAWPNVQSREVTRVTRNVMGGDPRYHLIFEATFASKDDLKECMGSDGFKRSGADMQFIGKRWGITPDLLLGEEF